MIARKMQVVLSNISHHTDISTIRKYVPGGYPP